MHKVPEEGHDHRVVNTLVHFAVAKQRERCDFSGQQVKRFIGLQTLVELRRLKESLAIFIVVSEHFE